MELCPKLTEGVSTAHAGFSPTTSEFEVALNSSAFTTAQTLQPARNVPESDTSNVPEFEREVEILPVEIISAVAASNVSPSYW